MTYHRPLFDDYPGGTYSPVNSPEGIFDKPLLYPIAGAMGKDFAAALIEWTSSNRDRFAIGGDGVHRRDVELPDADGVELVDELGRRVLELYPEALEACKVEPFEVAWLERHLIGYLQGDRFGWHTDHFQSSLSLREETKAITFLYYAHRDPRGFTGGGLEFFDGSVLEPDNDLLAFFNPYQRHRVLPVKVHGDAWLDGRWSVAGWAHRPERGELPTWDQEPGHAEPLYDFR